jgi:NADP-reducing hydrogenase subunit HndB
MADRITSPADLLAMAAKAKEGIDLRSGVKDVKVTVHMGTCGIASGARDVLAFFLREVGNARLDNVTVAQAGCAGLCDEEPMITITDAGGAVYHYGHLEDKARVREIVRRHLVEGTPVTEYLIKSA